MATLLRDRACMNILRMWGVGWGFVSMVGLISCTCVVAAPLTAPGFTANLGQQALVHQAKQAPAAHVTLGERPYPQGRRFPLGLYSLNPDKDMPAAREVGWNIAQTYGFKPEFLGTAAKAGLFALAHIDRARDDPDGGKTKALIAQMAREDNIAWWDLPEEMRYWRASEYDKVKALSAWTRAYDPLKRPNYMYIPGHYTPDAIAKYVDYLDIIGAGCYTEYAHQPRSWVRWRIESEIEAVRRAGHDVGPDYLHGQRTPIAVLMLFWEAGSFDITSPEEAYHDFWSAVCSGARGVLIFSYWHQRDADVLRKTYEAYCRAAREITGPEQLGQVFLFGKPYGGVSCAVVSGPRMSAPFQPAGYSRELRYPAVNVRALTWRGNLYVLVVNSAERGVRVHLGGLPKAAVQAEALFEHQKAQGGKPQPRLLPVAAGGLDDSLVGLGVHIYKIPIPTQK